MCHELINMCAMPHSYVCHDSHVRHDSFVCDSSICDSFICDLFVHAPCLIHTCAMTHLCDTTYSYMTDTILMGCVIWMSHIWMSHICDASCVMCHINNASYEWVTYVMCHMNESHMNESPMWCVICDVSYQWCVRCDVSYEWVTYVMCRMNDASYVLRSYVTHSHMNDVIHTSHPYVNASHMWCVIWMKRHSHMNNTSHMMDVVHMWMSRHSYECHHICLIHMWMSHICDASYEWRDIHIFIGKVVFISLRVSVNSVYKFQGKPGTTTVKHDFNPNGLKFHRGSPWVTILSWLNLKANKDYFSYEYEWHITYE